MYSLWRLKLLQTEAYMGRKKHLIFCIMISNINENWNIQFITAVKTHILLTCKYWLWYKKLVSKPSWYKLRFFRKRERRKWLLLFYLKNLGYCPTIYIMFDAIIALLSLPRLISHRPRRSWRTELINWLLNTNDNQ